MVLVKINLESSGEGKLLRQNSQRFWEKTNKRGCFLGKSMFNLSSYLEIALQPHDIRKFQIKRDANLQSGERLARLVTEVHVLSSHEVSSEEFHGTQRT